MGTRLTANINDTPLIEPNPSGDSPETGMLALKCRIRQQELLAELGVKALQGAKVVFYAEILRR